MAYDCSFMNSWRAIIIFSLLQWLHFVQTIMKCTSINCLKTNGKRFIFFKRYTARQLLFSIAINLILLILYYFILCVLDVIINIRNLKAFEQAIGLKANIWAISKVMIWNESRFSMKYLLIIVTQSFSNEFTWLSIAKASNSTISYLMSYTGFSTSLGNIVLISWPPIRCRKGDGLRFILTF